MEPNFYDSQYLIIDEISYRFSDPERGDVIVVKSPQSSSEFFIKRVIGLPNETVEIKGGQVSVYNVDYPEGFVLEESYLKEDIYTQGNKKVELNDNEYYILGDNRNVSLDSRSFGPLTEDRIIGRAWIRVWPFSEFNHFDTPEYQLTIN